MREISEQNAILPDWVYRFFSIILEVIKRYYNHESQQSVSFINKKNCEKTHTQGEISPEA